jgi:tetratricopeptide (TPR) repeat protein
MSQWVERIKGSPAFAELGEMANALELAREACSQEQAALDNWDRASAVVAHLRKALDQADPLLVVPGNLSNIASYLQQAKAEIGNFVANKNIGHWNTTQTHLDNCLAQLAALPRQTPEGIDGMREAATGYRTAISEMLGLIKKDGDVVTQQQAALQTKIAEATTEITAQKQRLDTAIATFQQQFSEAQQTRQTEFTSAEQARTQAAAKSEQERQEAFDEAEEDRAEAEKKASADAAQRHSELVTKLKADGDAIIAKMEKQREHAEKLIGIITDTGMAYGYQKTANEERGRAGFWKIVAVVSLVVWIAVGVAFFFMTYQMDLNWPTVARQLLISTPFILLAGFAALQVSRHQKSERGLRQAELELASIDPFLATLSNDERNEVKREFATRYFGHRETDSKHDAADHLLSENLVSISKTLQEIKKSVNS